LKPGPSENEAGFPPIGALVGGVIKELHIRKKK